MTEPLATLITRTVTVNEVMEQCGKKRLVYDPDEDLTLWDIHAMLHGVLVQIDTAIAQLWADGEAEADDD